MSVPLAIFLPVVGGLYGALVGAYYKSDKKTPARKRALVISGIAMLLIIIGVILVDCML